MDDFPPLPPRPSQDDEHLKLLVVFHYVAAALAGLAACVPLIHVGVGTVLLMAGVQNEMPPPPALFGLFFIFIGGVSVLVGWVVAICIFISGRFLAKRRWRTFSFVMAAIMCTFAPFGTVLGILTIIVLSRDSVQRLYEKTAAPAAT